MLNNDKVNEEKYHFDIGGFQFKTSSNIVILGLLAYSKETEKFK